MVNYQYADFDYYKNNYYGDKVTTEAEFKKLERKSKTYIDQYTVGRLKDATTIIDDVKYTDCEIIDILSDMNSNYGLKQSESVDKWSVSYNTTGSNASLDTKILEVLYRNLVNTDLMALY